MGEVLMMVAIAAVIPVALFLGVASLTFWAADPNADSLPKPKSRRV
jgi:hypothetical protein